MKKGIVYLVGAGPGRADLITVRGAEVLGKADCVIYDKLANPALLKFARADAEIIHVPKRIGGVSVNQEQINQLLLEKVSGGRTVVRLKGGDPCIFGRVSEELAVLNEKNIGFEIVPGITAGVAVSSYAGIMLTDRQYSSQVVFITGREAEGKQGSNIDWPMLANFPGTIVFYMGVGNLSDIAGRLIENGMPADTPAAVIANVTFPAQRKVTATLGNVADKCQSEQIEPPAIIIIGMAAKSDTNLDWFTKLPLFGTNIVITRDEIGNADFAEKIIARGGNPMQFETIKIISLNESNDFLQVLSRLSDYDWIIFTSVNGVKVFFEAIKEMGKDARIFASAKIAAIGSRTAEQLLNYGIKADFVPTVFTSAEFGRQLANCANLRDKRILMLRSRIASNELVKLLESSGALVDDIAIYTAEKQQSNAEALIEKIENGEIDWITFASPSAVGSFFEQIDAEVISSGKAKIASVGPVTTKALESLGAPVSVTAKVHTLDGLLEAIEQTYM